MQTVITGTDLKVAAAHHDLVCMQGIILCIDINFSAEHREIRGCLDALDGRAVTVRGGLAVPVPSHIPSSGNRFLIHRACAASCGDRQCTAGNHDIAFAFLVVTGTDNPVSRALNLQAACEHQDGIASLDAVIG